MNIKMYVAFTVFVNGISLVDSLRLRGQGQGHIELLVKPTFWPEIYYSTILLMKLLINQ